MMGLEQIKAANRNPRKHALSELSDGQLRRNNARPSAYWSEKPPYAETAIPNGESMNSMKKKGLAFKRTNGK